ncbi:hypothetical protein HK097_008192 [Rhizophlyctis rosea]|uniref:Methyltransferase domain-containing protein n=1 Tax=Rhizophlyctis rosea TaxID=64517 RepID=A0AAD5SDA9_9FUNG|nr:hypothetical protein HK097_008192 [Rhizophlyctis rosea]
MADQRPEGWSNHAKIYEKYTRYITGLFSHEALVVTGLLPPSKPAQKLKILDTATGTGILPLQIVEEYTKAGLLEDLEIVATDFAEGMIELLEKRIAEKGYGGVIKTEVMDAQNLTFPDATFTHAYMIFGIFFIPDPVKALRELHRTLLPGGNAALTSWGATDMFRLSAEVFRRLGGQGENAPKLSGGPYGHDWASASYIEGLCKQAGFSRTEGYENVERSVRFETHEELYVLMSDNPAIGEKFAKEEALRERWKETMLEVMRVNKGWRPVLDDNVSGRRRQGIGMMRAKRRRIDKDVGDDGGEDHGEEGPWSR